MSGFDYFKDTVLNKYTQFDGRARRSEYWYFTLFNVIIIYALLGIGFAFNSITLMGLPIIVGIGLILPSIGVLIRRLHDVGKSGWMWFIALIPIVGAIWLIVLLTKDSQPGSNAYGPNPKEIDSENAIHKNLV